MTSRIKHYFRAGHISMSPAIALPVLIAAARSTQTVPVAFPWQAPGLDTYNGTAAIAAMVRDIGLGEKDAVLLPAYCCGAELGPFRHAACAIYFYDVKKDLSIDRQTIESTVAAHPEIRLLLVTHYFGVPQPESLAISQWCKQQQIILAEDCAHALYSQNVSEPVGILGDYAIFSPRKSLPVTEGGRLAIRKPCNSSTLDTVARRVPRLPLLERLCYSLQQGARTRPDTLSIHGLASIAIIAISTIPSIVIKLLKAKGNFQAHHWLTPEVEGKDAVPVYDVGSSALSRRIFATGNAQTITQVRRDNYAYWLDRIKHSVQLKALIEHLPDGSCPLYFPVIVSDPAMCVESLAKADIEAFNWWQHMPEELLAQGSDAFPVACQLKQSVIALPVHQFVSHRQIDRMAELLTQAVS